MIKQIIVTLDGSGLAERALSIADALAAGSAAGSGAARLRREAMSPVVMVGPRVSDATKTAGTVWAGK
ncbi:MAG: hypothetical protein AB7R89_13370 [Dehalococcoidia bacterium]